MAERQCKLRGSAFTLRLSLGFCRTPFLQKVLGDGVLLQVCLISGLLCTFHYTEHPNNWQVAWVYTCVCLREDGGKFKLRNPRHPSHAIWNYCLPRSKSSPCTLRETDRIGSYNQEREPLWNQVFRTEWLHRAAGSDCDLPRGQGDFSFILGSPWLCCTNRK